MVTGRPEPLKAVLVFAIPLFPGLFGGLLFTLDLFEGLKEAGLFKDGGLGDKLMKERPLLDKFLEDRPLRKLPLLKRLRERRERRGVDRS